MLPGSGSKQALQTDGRDRAADREDRIEIGDLPVRIEQRDEKETAERAGDRPGADLERDEKRAAGAAVIVRQMPFAARTRGHNQEWGEAATR